MPQAGQCADSASTRERILPKAGERIEPTLAPINGLVRVRIRFNDRFAVALTDSEADLHGITIDDSWRDAVGEAPGRDVIVDVPVPPFGTPGKATLKTDRSWWLETPASAPPNEASAPRSVPPTPSSAPPVPRAAAPTPREGLPTAPALIQPTLSPFEHATRFLAWCRRHGVIGEIEIDALLRHYGRMCADSGIAPRAWNPVSRELTVLIEGRVGKKHYANRPSGKVRVFRIGAAPPPAQPACSQHGRPAGAGAALEQERAAA